MSVKRKRSWSQSSSSFPHRLYNVCCPSPPFKIQKIRSVEHTDGTSPKRARATLFLLSVRDGLIDGLFPAAANSLDRNLYQPCLWLHTSIWTVPHHEYNRLAFATIHFSSFIRSRKVRSTRAHGCLSRSEAMPMRLENVVARCRPCWDQFSTRSACLDMNRRLGSIGNGLSSPCRLPGFRGRCRRPDVTFLIRVEISTASSSLSSSSSIILDGLSISIFLLLLPFPPSIISSSSSFHFDLGQQQRNCNRSDTQSCLLFL